MGITVEAYHDRTKHGYRRFARSAGHLDWATQPEAWRVFEGAEIVRLPFETADREAPYDNLYRPGAAEPSPIDATSVADLLFHSLAVSAWKQAGSSRWALRVNPSSGNLHPTEGYLVLPAAADLGDAPGVYHYLSRDHVLQRRATLSTRAWDGLGLPAGSFLVGLTSIEWREAWKYGERAFRYCQHDAGHAIAAVSLAASLRGWHVRCLTGWSTGVVARILGVDRDGDFPSAAEREEPEVLLLVSPETTGVEPPPPGDEVLALFRDADWQGRANRLSPSHVDWIVVGEVAEASRATGEPWPVGEGDPWPAFPAIESGRPACDARHIVRTRRSGVDFLPEPTTSRASFLRILDRVLPRAGAPWEAMPWGPRIHLALFVHRVEDVEPGIYVLVRDPGAEEGLRAAMRDDFTWETPEGVPDGFPLRRLATGDARDTAAQLSCGQDIAGDSFFSLGMIAEFEASLLEVGPAFYRALFREAGAVGQVLYLEAEAEGVRGTGIGCYFDDPVHETLGLEGRTWQSLYHFTIGIPIEDDRLTTLAAYDT